MERFSRREFLEKFVPQSPEKQDDNLENSGVIESAVGHKELSRRDFLRVVGGIGLALTLEQIGVRQVRAQEADKKEEVSNPQLDQDKNSKETVTQDQQQETEKADSYAKTVLQQILVIGAEELVDSVLKKLGVGYGRESLSEEEITKYLKKNPIEGIIKLGVLCSVVEETLFRLLPSSFIDRNSKSHRWDIGIPMSAIFALMHNIEEVGFKEDKVEVKFAKPVPVSLFMAGLFFWYLMRERGYSHAVLAHFIHIAVPLSIGALLFKIYPEEKAERMAKEMFGVKEGKKD